MKIKHNFKISTRFSLVLGQLPPRKIVPNPKTNSNLNPNPNPNRGWGWLGEGGNFPRGQLSGYRSHFMLYQTTWWKRLWRVWKESEFSFNKLTSCINEAFKTSKFSGVLKLSNIVLFCLIQLTKLITGDLVSFAYYPKYLKNLCISKLTIIWKMFSVNCCVASVNFIQLKMLYLEYCINGKRSLIPQILLKPLIIDL